MLELQKNGANENVRQRAKTLFDSIAGDYERVSKEQNDGLSALQAAYGNELDKARNDPNFIPFMIKVIREEQSLSDVANNFLLLREATGHPFQMFDFEAIEKWCSENSEKCKMK